jgi:DNA-binding transcriptional ArsR family regulator
LLSIRNVRYHMGVLALIGLVEEHTVDGRKKNYRLTNVWSRRITSGSFRQGWLALAIDFKSAWSCIRQASENTDE